MELNNLLVFFVTLFLSIPNSLCKLTTYSDPQFNLWTLSNRHHIISIDANGTLYSSATSPTLYSVIRSELYADIFVSSNAPEFSLVGIASGFRICMNKFGFIYTKKLTKKEKQLITSMKIKKATSLVGSSVTTVQTYNNDKDSDNEDDDEDPEEVAEGQGGIPGNVTGFKVDVEKEEATNTEHIPPPEECLFKSYIFDQKETYHYKTAVYSAISQNNASNVANFLAFYKDGHVRRYRRPLDKVSLQKAIVIHFDPIRKLSSFSISTRSSSNPFNNPINTNIKMDNILTQTTFKHCNGRAGRKLFNIKVRNCIRNSTKSLNVNRLNHTNLSKIIKKCQCPVGKICRKNGCVRISKNLKDINNSNNNHKSIQRMKERQQKSRITMNSSILLQNNATNNNNNNNNGTNKIFNPFA